MANKAMKEHSGLTSAMYRKGWRKAPRNHDLVIENKKGRPLTDFGLF